VRAPRSREGLRVTSVRAHPAPAAESGEPDVAAGDDDRAPMSGEPVDRVGQESDDERIVEMRAQGGGVVHPGPLALPMSEGRVRRGGVIDERDAGRRPRWIPRDRRQATLCRERCAPTCRIASSARSCSQVSRTIGA